MNYYEAAWWQWCHSDSEGFLFFFLHRQRAGDGARGKKGVICEGLLYHQLVRGFRSFWCSSVHTVVQAVRLDLSALL